MTNNTQAVPTSIDPHDYGAYLDALLATYSEKYKIILSCYEEKGASGATVGSVYLHVFDMHDPGNLIIQCNGGMKSYMMRSVYRMQMVNSNGLYSSHVCQAMDIMSKFDPEWSREHSSQGSFIANVGLLEARSHDMHTNLMLPIQNFAFDC